MYSPCASRKAALRTTDGRPECASQITLTRGSRSDCRYVLVGAPEPSSAMINSQRIERQFALEMLAHGAAHFGTGTSCHRVQRCAQRLWIVTRPQPAYRAG